MVPQQPADQTCREHGQSDAGPIDAEGGRLEIRRDDGSEKGLLYPLCKPHEKSVQAKEHPNGGRVLSDRKSEIENGKQHESKKNNPFPAEFVRRHACRNGGKGINKVEH